jgi:hypothetical protein
MGRSAAAVGIDVISDTRALSRGIGGGGTEGTDRWSPGGSDCGARTVMGRRFACFDGPGCYRSRTARRKRPTKLFPFWNSFPI